MNRLPAPVVPTPVAVLTSLGIAFMPYPGELAILLGATCVLGWLVLVNGTAWRLLTIPVPALLVAAWCLMSAAWSVGPVATTQAALKLSCLTFIAVAVAAGRRRRQLLELMTITSKWLLAICWTTALVVPSVGLTQSAYEHGTLEGLFAHRNLMGYAATWCLVTLLAAARSSRTPAAGHAWAAAAALTVFATSSRTSWLVAALAVCLLVAIRGLATAPRPRGAAVASLASFALVIGAALVAGYGAVAESLGRDATLTGRTLIWDAVLAEIQRRPIIGSGWGAAWTTGSPVGDSLADQVGFRFFHAHNGYLDLMLQIGVVGLALAAILWGAALAGALRDLSERFTIENAWLVTILATVLLFSVTESVALDNFGYFLVVVIVAERCSDRARETGAPHAPAPPTVPHARDRIW